ncbi:hypothetical protein GCM10010837_04750 [Aminobacter niigataensis]
MVENEYQYLTTQFRSIFSAPHAIPGATCPEPGVQAMAQRPNLWGGLGRLHPAPSALVGGSFGKLTTHQVGY